jgi:hypothetical protein
VISEDAENAVRNLHRLKDFYVATAKHHPLPARGRRRGPRTRPIGHRQRTLYESTIVRCVTIIEAYLSNRAEAVTEERLRVVLNRTDVPASSRALAAFLRDEAWTTAERTWNAMQTYWSDGLQIPITDRWGSRISALRETRHSIVHHMGHITDRYRKSAADVLRAAGLDPQAASGLIPINATDVDAAITLTKDFIMWIDRRS